MKQNILFLFADQMHAFAMGCMGTDDIQTPNLDRLAARGALFRSCYSSNPVCSPWRAALMTGRNSCQTGMVGINNLPVPPGEWCLADLLHAQDYRTSYVGKWHIGDSGNIPVPEGFRCGFREFIGFQCFNDFYEDVWMFDEENRKHVYQKHRTEVMTDVAIERLERLKGQDQPFAMFVSWSNPHYPVQPSPEFEALYAGKTIKKRPNYLEGIEPFTPNGRRGPDGTYETNKDNLRLGGEMDEYLRLYYAMVSQLDANIGRLLDQLDEWGLTSETMIVFTSDHGDMQGSHGRINKHAPYEESTCCPLIIAAPGAPKGVVVDTPVDTVDFLPTLLDAAEAPPSPLAEGRSLLPLVHGRTTDHKAFAFVENSWPHGEESYFMTVDSRYKVVVKMSNFAPRHLFDLQEDPYELQDLVDDPDHADRLADLVQRLRDHQAGLMARANPRRYLVGDTGHWVERLGMEPPLTDCQRYSPEFINRYVHSRRG